MRSVMLDNPDPVAVMAACGLVAVLFFALELFPLTWNQLSSGMRRIF